MARAAEGHLEGVIEAVGKLAACVAGGASRDLLLQLVMSSTHELLACDAVSIGVRRPDYGVTTIAMTGDDKQPLGSLLFVPIRVDGRRGWLCAGRAFGAAPFGQDDFELAHLFASHVSLVLEQDHFRRHNAALDRVAEQWRLATELQSLAGEQIFHASVRLSGALSEIGDELARERVVHAIDDLDHAIKIIRQIAFGLIESV